MRISLSPSLSQKSTYDERCPPPFIPLSFVFCLCGVEGWRVLPQVEDATAAASLVGLTGGEKEGGGVEVGAGAAAATCGCKTCLHYAAPPLLQRMLDWGRGVRIPIYINHPPPPLVGASKTASLPVVNRINSGFFPWKIRNNIWCWLAEALQPPSHQL